MDWQVTEVLPEVCRACQEEDCYNCDYAGERWRLSKENELRLRRKGLMRAIARMQRQVQEIDRQLFQK